MRIHELHPKTKKKPNSQLIFDTTQLTGKTAMADKHHPLAELLRDELILRFLGRNLNAGPVELLKICHSFLYSEFRHYPLDILESAIKDLRRFSPDFVADTHLFTFLKQRIAAYLGTDSLDDLVFEAAVSRELGETKSYPPFVNQLVDELSETKWRAIRKQLQELHHSG